jgi:hypothetical protein
MPLLPTRPLLCLVGALSLPASAGPETLEAVDLYGLRTIPEAAVRAAVGLAAGDPAPASLEAIRGRLRALPGVADVGVSLVCCGERGGSLLYVGVREEGAPTVVFRPAPAGDARLPAEVVALGARHEAALVAAVRRGATGEDASQGYALSADAALRAVQEELRDVARAGFDGLAAVLRLSADAAHRTLAARILAYGDDRQAVACALVAAVGDPSERVRNDAARALALLAGWADGHPDAGVSIPPDPFVDVLNSVSWTDRNKGVLVLVPLTVGRDPALLATLRERALPSLVEMARWSDPGHALAPYILVARLAGVDDGAAFRAWQAGEREVVIARALREGA